MATKSKNTSTFKGLISWLCLMAFICAIAIGFLFLVAVPIDPVLREEVIDLLQRMQSIAQKSVSPEAPAEIVLALQAEKEALYQMVLMGVCFLTLFIVVLVFVFAFRQDRRQFEAAIAEWLSKIWVEVKLLVIGFVMIFCLLLDVNTTLLFGTATLCAGIILLYFVCLDIGHNKSFFRHNIIRSILRSLNSYKAMTTFQQRSLRRVYSCLGVIVGILALVALVFFGFSNMLYYHPLFLIGFVLFAVIGVLGTIWWYVLALKEDLRDWNVLMAQIAEMYGGNLDAVNHVPPTSNLYDCAMQLNMIRTGIQKTVEEGIKADRTKVELITNVSHDLKTPLTSIISYVELLKKEPNLPTHLMDYVNTISRKADRLSHMVQDVFEVSKAATGNISLDLEDLDVGKLLQQTFAEMDETLRNSQLTWRVDIPDAPILIHADGQRLYRVFQNLIRNCAQYSLEGSRAYVNLKAQNGCALVSIRNISRNEITMDGNDLTSRFVRGDQNRTTEGSGLGLSIAKSFTEACGGQFAVHTDGDLFTVTVQFPQVTRPQPAEPDPVPIPEPAEAPTSNEPPQA